ncbi:Multidrug resistance protein 1 [Smittium mucronatum]|uniref:Multidrug resistance protein 1 n=1 Tax=Smittium mucronatum TaxID=133383 RepID=A0A1R0GLR2_9FUNG|nr:Multidrug resistance protein 1 [Smittium mucronatum]OLY82058.1 Multidrug resistance protein 1 [Smittium mucronatum]
MNDKSLSTTKVEKIYHRDSFEKCSANSINIHPFKASVTADDISEPPASISALFLYCSKGEKILLILGLFLASLSGLTQAVVTYFFSQYCLIFIDYDSVVKEDGLLFANSNMVSKARSISLIFLWIGIFLFVVSYCQNVIFSALSLRMSMRVKELYYKSAISQNMAFYDCNDPNLLFSKISSEISALQDGTGVKFGYILQFAFTFLGEVALALYMEYRMALVALSILPFSSIIGYIMGRYLAKYDSLIQESDSITASIIIESISYIKTVISFNAQNIVLNRFRSSDLKSQNSETLKIKTLSFGVSLIFFFTISSYALSLWYGAYLIRIGKSQPLNVLVVFFALSISGFSLSGITPSITALSLARSSAKKIYKIIDSKSSVDPMDSSKGIKADHIKGKVKFISVGFSYPNIPDSNILSDFNLIASPGQKIALVGSSGSGKSTVLNLLQRFYDPTEGSILIDDIDIKEYNIKSLRSQIGVVKQEPTMFNSSIFDNIAYGASNYDTNIPSLEEVENACKIANIHDFISSLPNNYDTMVGEKGAQLSGGQKQRIAIARAIIRNPKILILDEATSALDSHSENLVQEAIDNCSQKCTVIAVSHRLSTIKEFDNIYVLSHGSIIENGTHKNLISLNSVYSDLVFSQSGEPENRTTKFFKKPDLSDVVLKGSSNSSEKFHSTVPAFIGENNLNEKRGIWSFIFLIFSNGISVPYILLGSAGAIIDGSLFPIFSIFFAKMIIVLGELDISKQRKNSNLYSILVFFIAVLTFFSVLIKTYFFGISFQNLCKKLKLSIFKSVLNQKCQFFDRQENGTGTLSLKITSEPGNISSFGSDTLPMIITSISSIITGMAIGFYKSWRLTLIAIALLPFMLFSESVQSKIHAGATKSGKKDTEKISNLISESLQNIQTVSSLSIENTFLGLLKDSNKRLYKFLLRGYLIGSISYGFSQSSVFMVYIAMFYAGAIFISKGVLTSESMFNALYAIVLATVAVGRTSQFLPFMPKALLASASINEMLCNSPVSKPDNNQPAVRNGFVSGSQIEFSYPNRPEVKTLKKVTFLAKPGQKIAFVGNSGSGKSTIVSLILKLYKATDGIIEVDCMDVNDWGDYELRNTISIVSQEPCLFNVSVCDNIKFGNPKATQYEIELAATRANIHKTILDLPDGYNTIVGSNGDKLSGGQKQRIAIARSIISNPKVLLLDEATSALDYSSENLVQNSLDSASQGRTTIVVSHRISTIMNSDMIYVIDDGMVVEQGKHHELLNLNGTYKRLVLLQNL